MGERAAGKTRPGDGEPTVAAAPQMLQASRSALLRDVDETDLSA
jgi:hypothetical protein